MTDSTVYIYVGASASGKTTYARNLSATLGNIVIACRDDIRRSLGYPPLGNREQENMVTKIHRGIIEAGINEGLDIHVPDTNLNKQFRKHLIKFIHEMGANVQLVIFDVPLDELYKRTDNRPLEEQVLPREVIKRQYDSLQTQLKDGTLDTLEFPVQSYEPYKHVEGQEEVIVVDIDHTIALCDGIRSPYDYTKVGLDAPNEDVIAVVRSLAEHYPIFFVSGRDGGCREDTEAWIRKHVIDDFTLLMRPAGNVEPDYIIKNRIADQDLIPNYNIRVWIDDRLQVIRHVRSRGITVLDVNGSRF